MVLKKPYWHEAKCHLLVAVFDKYVTDNCYTSVFKKCDLSLENKVKQC